MKGERNKEFPNAIPLIEVDSIKEAKSFQILYGSLALDGRYIYPRFKGTLEALDEVQAIFAKEKERRNKKETNKNG